MKIKKRASDGLQVLLLCLALLALGALAGASLAYWAVMTWGALVQ